MKEKIIKWADDRGLLVPGNHYKQTIKLAEEVGELCGSILKQNDEDAKDAFGDIQVVLIILAEQMGMDLDKCLESAWNVIKDRTGKTIDGTFVKDE